MWNYITLAASAWFMGFFPMLEIYLAIPAAVVMGLDPVSAVIWGGLGNFFPIPFIAFFHHLLLKIKPVKRWLDKLSDSKYKEKIEKHGALFVLLLTPLMGSWVVGVIANGLGMKKAKLFISSAVSILIYGIVIAVLSHFGMEFAGGIGE